MTPVPLHVVLVTPEIPLNTGSVGRLCVCNDLPLHLIKPLGFSLEERRVRRAGLDYWKYLDLRLHESWDDFLEKENPKKIFFSSSKGKRPYWDYSFCEGDYLIFGSETHGLPPDCYKKYSDLLYHIPMGGTHARTLNLANSVSIVVYEAFRQMDFQKKG